MAEILFLAHRIPYPPTKGDKIRAYRFLAHLARRHVVHLGCFVDDADDWRHVDHLRTICAECHFGALSRSRVWLRALSALARDEAISVALLRDAALANWVEALLARRPIDRVFVYSGAMAQFLPQVPPCGVRRIVDFVDVDADKWRQIASRRPWPWSWLYRRESERLRAFDRTAAGRCDHCLFVSPAEAQSFRSSIPTAAPRVLVIPNGVDSGRFSPELRFPCPFGQGGPVIAFTGDMSYWPNEDAVLWFAREVLPRLHRDHPGLRFVVVGRTPGRRLRRSAARLRMMLTGAVPDVRPFLAHAAIVVAPLRIAQGVPNKVLEAMAMGKPVVATPAALAGLRVDPGRDIVVADAAADFATAVVSLLDAPRAASVGAHARARVLADYPWASSFGSLDRLMATSPSDAQARQELVTG